MAKIQELRMEERENWAIGFFVHTPSDVIIPVESLGNLSDADIVRYVRTSAYYAKELLAKELLAEWDGWVKSAPSEKLQQYLLILSDAGGPENEWIRRAYARIRMEFDRRHRRRISRRAVSANGDGPGYVYLAYCDTGHYKIGLSVDPSERIKHFDTKMPVQVSLVHVIETDNMQRLESELHAKFEDKRVTGEWFELDENDVEWIIKVGSP